MKKILKSYGCTATITDHADGTATLKIKVYTGSIVHNKKHASHKAAMNAWYRYCS